MHDPMDLFRTIWAEAKRQGTLTHRNAVCVSTIDAEGYPNSRFVDLKDVDERGLVFCTRLDSVKALDLGRDPKAGITVWWEHVATQVRIRGSCTAISTREADAYWRTRTRDAQVATVAFRQSRPLAHPDALAGEYARAVHEIGAGEIPRPAEWGGFRLRPDHVEFLVFRASRLHVRTAYRRTVAGWEERFLQP